MEKEVKIYQTTIKNKTFLKFDFPEHLYETTAENALNLWNEEIKKMKIQGKIDLVFDCLVMTGFETGARKKWQSTMKEKKNEIGKIWIVSENVFIQGAAKTMGVLAGYSIKTARSISEIEENI